MKKKFDGNLNPGENTKCTKKKTMLFLVLTAMTFICSAAFAQNVQVTGVVSFAKDKDPIIGANVIVEGTTNGTITDFDGNFTLDVPVNSNLVVSYIGCKPQVFKITGKQHLTIALDEDSQTLDEVVVVGYGTQKKVNLTGAVATTDGKILQDRPINTISSGLQGAVPGLNISPKNGKANESTSFNIRGTTSINGGSPLVLVDGVEMDVDLVNPNDIANITVLKDAASSAIYGVRAAYGVILITTKNATTEKTTVSYSGSFTISKPTVDYDFVDNSVDHVDFMNTAVKNAGLTDIYDEKYTNAVHAYYKDPKKNPEYEIVNGEYRYYGYNDWKSMVLKNTAPSHRHNINISGGSEKTKFYSSIGFIQQKGFYQLNNDDYRRFNSRIAVDNQTTDWLKLSMKALYNHSIMDEPHTYESQTPWYRLNFTSPVRPLKWVKDPKYPDFDQYDGMYFDDQNVYSIIDQGGRNKKNVTDAWLMGDADIQIMKGWSAHVGIAYNRKTSDAVNHKKQVKMITSKFVPTDGHTKDNQIEKINTIRSYYSFNAYTQYERTFLNKHYIKAMAGYNQELTQYSSATAIRKDLLSQEVPTLSLGSGEHSVKDDGYEWALRGGFFRLNYIYNDRYLIEVNGRYDGTSRFPKDNRFVFLPSVSAAWRISEEKFMDWSREYLDNLKIRGSYGVLGNQLISSDDWKGNTKYYPYIPFLTGGLTSNTTYGDVYDTQMTPAKLVSQELTWEKAASTNLGVDVTMLNSRLDFTFDVFQRVTSDMMMKVKYPAILGAEAPPANAAELTTRGWELSIGWKDRIGKHFTYGLGFVLSDSQAEITKYDNPSGTLSDHYVGKKWGEIWGYETEGIIQSPDDMVNHDQSFIGKDWEPGDIKYKDLNNDNKVDKGKNTIDDHGDLKIIGNTTSRYNYGITANLGYKGFYLNIFMQGVGKRDFWPEGQAFWPASTQYFAVQKWFVEESWSENNRDAYFSRPLARQTKNKQAQSRYLQDASYLRMKNLTFGYDFPKAISNKLCMSKLQVYISGENLFEFKNTKGPYDPESAEGKGGVVYPFQRSFSIGLNVTF